MSVVKVKLRFNFEDELRRALARAERLRAAQEGRADVTEVRVRAHKVKAHDRAAHVRYAIRVRR